MIVMFLCLKMRLARSVKLKFGYVIDEFTFCASYILLNALILCSLLSRLSVANCDGL